MQRPLYFPEPSWRERFTRAVADPNERELNEMLDELDRGYQLQNTRGYNMALLRGSMEYSKGRMEQEFSADCIYQLACMYDHPPLGGAGCFTYETPDRFLDAPQPPTILPGQQADAQRIRFNSFGAGMVIGIIGSVLDEDTGLAVDPSAVSFRLQINGQQNLNTDGQDITFTNYGSLLRQQLPYFPFRRLVSALDFMDVTFRSNIVAPGPTVIPNFTLCFGRLLERIA